PDFDGLVLNEFCKFFKILQNFEKVLRKTAGFCCRILKNGFFQDSVFVDWHQRWLKRLVKNKIPVNMSLDLMRITNPLIIPRNHKVEEALNAASINNNLAPMNNLLRYLKKPYNKQSGITDYQSPPEPSEQTYKTFCGT
ncbi:hypothetical protein, partial [Croceibacter atlanticus]|uniref:hypothetical protein n=1 Tax=Croceibacter atlanticus TaxID=313588 RepID=UPI0032B1F41B